MSVKENSLSGEIPTDLAEASLHGNQLTGELPAGVAGMYALELFGFSVNGDMCSGGGLSTPNASLAWPDGEAITLTLRNHSGRP